MIKVDTDLNFPAGIDGGSDYYVIQAGTWRDGTRPYYLRWISETIPGGLQTDLDGSRKFATAEEACNYLQNMRDDAWLAEMRIVRATWTHSRLHYYFPGRGPAQGPLSRVPGFPNRWPHLIVSRHFALVEMPASEQKQTAALLWQLICRRRAQKEQKLANGTF